MQIISLVRAEDGWGREVQMGPGVGRLSLLSRSIAGVRPTLLSELVLPKLHVAGVNAQLFCSL